MCVEGGGISVDFIQYEPAVLSAFGEEDIELLASWLARQGSLRSQ